MFQGGSDIAFMKNIVFCEVLKIIVSELLLEMLPVFGARKDI